MEIIKDIIYPVLEEFKEDENLDFELSNNLELFGKNSVFDSLSLVRFIVNIQDKILEVTDKEIVVVSADAMSRAKSPFKTVQTLADYIDELLKNV